jgi:RimJ/RimL family protein N-acetyltransferase
MVRLEPMSSSELTELLDRLAPGYAEDHVRAGNWPVEGSLERARAEIAHLLPKGVETPDHFLRTLREEGTGERLGETWYCRREGELFIFWLGIDPAHRRRGHAASVLHLLEAEARRLGARRMGLHVFAANEGARALYEREGFRPVGILMTRVVPA